MGEADARAMAFHIVEQELRALDLDVHGDLFGKYKCVWTGAVIGSLLGAVEDAKRRTEGETR